MKSRSSSVVFTKMEGAGNDFVVIDARHPLDLPPEVRPDSEVLPKCAEQLCDRHFGVGADGVVLIEPSLTADFRVVYLNRDGSRSVCGNGTRCAASFLYRRDAVLSRSFTLETDDRIVNVDVIGDGDQVRVDMGEPEFSGTKIPVTETGEQIGIGLLVDGELVTLTAVSMGNPHAVVFVPSVAKTELHRLGPALENHQFFPEKTNVEFVEVVDPTEVRIRIWERGVGETLACGTGTCAVLAAGVRQGKLARQVTVHSPGGEFLVVWNTESNRIFLTGPAREVFLGELALSAFNRPKPV